MEYRLDELFDLQMGKTPSRNNPEYWNTKDNKWISIADLSKCGKYIDTTKECISNKAVSESGIAQIPENTVIMSFKLSIGKTAITTESMYSNEAIISFRDKHIVEVLPEYLYYLVLSKDWSAGTNKAVMGKTLNKATLSKIKVNIYDISQQHEVVDILDKVNNVILSRKQELQKLDELVKSRFVELFSGTFEVVSAEDVCSDIVDCPHSTPKYDEKELIYPAIRTSEIQNGSILWDSMKYVGVVEYEKRVKRLKPERGDVVYAREGTYGDCVILPDEYEFCLGQRTMLFRPDYKICTSAYLHAALRSDAVNKQADESNAGSQFLMLMWLMQKNFIFHYHHSSFSSSLQPSSNRSTNRNLPCNRRLIRHNYYLTV